MIWTPAATREKRLSISAFWCAHMSPSSSTSQEEGGCKNHAANEERERGRNLSFPKFARRTEYWRGEDTLSYRLLGLVIKKKVKEKGGGDGHLFAQEVHKSWDGQSLLLFLFWGAENFKHFPEKKVRKNTIFPLLSKRNKHNFRFRSQIEKVWTDSLPLSPRRLPIRASRLICCFLSSLPFLYPDVNYPCDTFLAPPRKLSRSTNVFLSPLCSCSFFTRFDPRPTDKLSTLKAFFSLVRVVQNGNMCSFGSCFLSSSFRFWFARKGKDTGWITG